MLKIKLRTLLFLPLLTVLVWTTLLISAQAAIPPDPGPSLETSSVSTACQKFVDKEKDPEGIKVKECEATTPVECKKLRNVTDGEKENFQKCLDKYVLASNRIVKAINKIVAFLSGFVAVVITGALILGGIQYSMAGDKAEAVSAAKKRITNALIALLIFILTFTFLQWLIPGGIFNV